MRSTLRLHLVMTLGAWISASSALAFDSTSGNFSIDPPADWKSRPTGLPYRPDPIIEAPKATEGIRPRILFGEEKLDQGDTLEVFVSEVMKVWAKYDRYKFISRSSVKTKSGIEVVKVTYERYSRLDRSMLRCVTYMTLVRGRTVLMVDLEANPATPEEVFAQAEAAVLTLKSK